MLLTLEDNADLRLKKVPRERCKKQYLKIIKKKKVTVSYSVTTHEIPWGLSFKWPWQPRGTAGQLVLICPV